MYACITLETQQQQPVHLQLGAGVAGDAKGIAFTHNTTEQRWIVPGIIVYRDSYFLFLVCPLTRRLIPSISRRSCIACIVYRTVFFYFFLYIQCQYTHTHTLPLYYKRTSNGFL